MQLAAFNAIPLFASVPYVNNKWDLKHLRNVSVPLPHLFYRGNSGPIDVTRPSTVDASILAFLRSTQHLKLQNIGNGQAGEAGMDHHQSYKPVRDFNAARYHGASLAQFNIRDGQRRTPLEGYLFKGNLDDPPDDKVITHCSVLVTRFLLMPFA